jgi:hypothetical protein
MAVAIWLRVGDTSTYDISLTSSGVRVLDYPMNAPDINQMALQSLGDGNSLGVPSFSNVTESIDIHVSDSTAALVADKVRAIERLLDLARQGTLGHLGDKLFLRIQFDHDAVVWRSQILAARLEMEEGSNQIWKKFVRGTLIITRRYYWEAETLQQVELSSGASGTTMGYATMYNNDDVHATNRNWVDIAAAQVTGSLPAPAWIAVKNSSGSARSFSALYIGNYVFSGSDTVDPIFRAEDVTFGDGTPGTTEQEIFTWSMGALADSFRGQFGRFVVVWSDLPAATTLVRALVDFRFPVPTFPLALGELMLATGDAVMDLGGLPIPPANWVSGGMGDKMALTLHAKAATGTDTLNIDWLQIFPSGKGLYRVIKAITTYSVAVDEIVVDNGPADAVYSVDGSDIYPVYRPFFDPIYLWPGRQQRLRFVISGGTSIEAGHPWGILIQYRPRRQSF